MGGAIVSGEGSRSGSWVVALEQGWMVRASKASEERGVELTRLNSGVRGEVERKMASADLRSVLEGAPSVCGCAAVGYRGRNTARLVSARWVRKRWEGSG